MSCEDFLSEKDQRKAHPCSPNLSRGSSMHSDGYGVPAATLRVEYVINRRLLRTYDPLFAVSLIKFCEHSHATETTLKYSSHHLNDEGGRIKDDLLSSYFILHNSSFRSY